MAVPLGVIYKINPITVVVMSVAGAVTGVIILLFVGGKIKDFIMKKVKKKYDMKDSKLIHIWEKYGVIGLGVIGSIIVGSPVIAVLGVILNVNKKRLILYTTIGIFIKAVLLASAAYAGFSFLKII